MKLVIQTQYRENYGAHDWDGKGECPQYWKCKGGQTYVVEGLSDGQIHRALEQGTPTLKSLIEYRNDGSEECIISVSGEADDAVVCEEWQTPTRISYEDGRWVAREVEVNDEYGYMNQKVAKATKQWDMLPGGDRKNYSAVYTMRDGKEIKGTDTAAMAKALAA